MAHAFIEEWCNGSTVGFDPTGEGSKPSFSANEQLIVWGDRCMAMRGNTISVNLVKGRQNCTDMLFQYDYGQIMFLRGVELPTTYEVHFSNARNGESKTIIGNANGVEIPDEYLTTGMNIYWWLFLHNSEDDGETEYYGVIPVAGRSAPSDMPPTPEQQSAITQAIAALNDAIEQTARDATIAQNSTTMIAPIFDQAVENPAGSYVSHEGILYLLPNGHEESVSWDNTTKIATKVVSDLKVLNDEMRVCPEIKTSMASGVDLDISDEYGNVLMRLQNGHILTKNFDSSNAGNMICYVAPNGLDTNSGDSTHPFLTIQHAVDSGYNRIMLAPGEYKNQKVTIEGKHGISIICNTTQNENNLFESHKRQARAKLDNSIEVTGLEAYNSIYRTLMSVDSDSSYYKVFISQTVDPVYSGADYYGRVTTYNAILWEITDNILTCTRLVPKLSLSDCESTAGTFYYDGTYLYVHPTNGSLTGVSYKRLNDDTFSAVTNGFYINNSTDIFIEGLDVQFFPYYGFHANIVSGLQMRDCGFYFTCYGSACEFHDCNADLYECNSAKAGADGFGIASYGNVSFYNCNAVYCYDDGISHHDGTTGIIDGGIWTYCKKGGVTPSFGSHVTVKNVIASHNVYGIYWTQSNDRVTDGKQYMQNCLAVDNTTKDIKVTGYDVVSHGCSYGTKEVDSGASLTEYNSTVIA